LTRELTECHFQIVHGLSDQQQHHNVRYYECAASILVSRVGEPPNVAQSNAHGNARHQTLDTFVPSGSYFHRFAIFNGLQLGKEIVKSHPAKASTQCLYTSFEACLFILNDTVLNCWLSYVYRDFITQQIDPARELILNWKYIQKPAMFS
jgi:hypothetical protein